MRSENIFLLKRCIYIKEHHFEKYFVHTQVITQGSIATNHLVVFSASAIAFGKSRKQFENKNELKLLCEHQGWFPQEWSYSSQKEELFYFTLNWHI